MNTQNLRVISILVGIVGSLIWYFFRDFFESGGLKHLYNVSNIVWHNPGFWIMIAISVVFGIYRKLTNKDEFLWKELFIQIPVSLIVLLGLYTVFFTTSTDISDIEVWNGHVTKAEYYEKWTEKIESTDDKGNKSVSFVEHPPEWKVLTTAGDFTTNQGVYANYRNRFHGEKKETVFRMNQSSIGDGNMYYVPCEQNPRDLIPASRPHLYVNYLKASDSIRKLRGNVDAYKAYLQPYPKVRENSFGAIEFDRVVVAGVQVPADWSSAVDSRLDHELKTLSFRKKVNVVVYVVGSKDRNFANALRESWIQGKKNDVIVVIGSTQFPKAEWFDVIAWTKVEEFPIQLRNRLMDLGDLTSADEFVNIVVQEIGKPKSAGGYERSPMSDYEYLLSDISLPVWCQVIVVLIGAAAAWFTSVMLINNRWRQWSPSNWTSGSFRRVWQR
jgi:hypothetical protein